MLFHSMHLLLVCQILKPLLAHKSKSLPTPALGAPHILVIRILMLVEQDWAHFFYYYYFGGILVLSRPFNMSLIMEFQSSKRKPSEERPSLWEGKEEEGSSPQIDPADVGLFREVR